MAMIKYREYFFQNVYKIILNDLKSEKKKNNFYSRSGIFFRSLEDAWHAFECRTNTALIIIINRGRSQFYRIHRTVI